jgi:hypothetical protein
VASEVLPALGGVWDQQVTQKVLDTLWIEEIEPLHISE